MKSVYIDTKIEQNRAPKSTGARLKSLPRAALASRRRSKTVNLLTGPCADRCRDQEVIRRFLTRDGAKIVSGGTTARIVAEYLDRPIKIEDNPETTLVPPRCYIDGIDLVTEGAVTLNQVYNTYDEDPEAFDEKSGVTDLVKLLKSADRVNLTVGNALNPASEDTSFRQRGILTRQAIIPLIVEKLKSAGKLVVVESC